MARVVLVQILNKRKNPLVRIYFVRDRMFSNLTALDPISHLRFLPG